VIALITFRWHGTAVQVTAVTIAYLLPLAIIRPVAGIFVDHWNMKRVMIASDLIRLLAQGLGIRRLFLSSVGVLALIAGAGYLMVKDQPAPATTANTQS
jgi:MFS family permease